MINPFYRVEKHHWSKFVDITQDTLGLTLSYDFDHPIFLRVTSPFDGSYYFILENRRRSRFDAYTPNSPADSVLQGGSLLIWHVNLHAGHARGPKLTV